MLNKKEKLMKILESELEKYKSMSFNEAEKLVGNEPVIIENKNTNNEGFWQIEIEFFYEDDTKNNIIIIGTIDDGGLRSMFLPYSKSYTITRK
jgi:hypothetical protein